MAGEKSTTYANLVLAAMLTNTVTGITNIVAAGSQTQLYLSLHTADPAASGTQTTNEVTTTQYGAYTRVAVNRSAAVWTVTGATATLTAAVSFPTTTVTGTGVTATYFAIGALSSGAGAILYTGPITPNIVIPATTAGVIPQLTTSTTITEA